VAGACERRRVGGSTRDAHVRQKWRSEHFFISASLNAALQPSSSANSASRAHRTAMASGRADMGLTIVQESRLNMRLNTRVRTIDCDFYALSPPGVPIVLNQHNTHRPTVAGVRQRRPKFSRGTAGRSNSQLQLASQRRSSFPFRSGIDPNTTAALRWNSSQPSMVPGLRGSHEALRTP